MPTYYTVKEAAKLLGVSTNTLYKYLLEGKIKASRGTAEGRFRIPPKSLEDFLGSPLPTSDLPPVTSSLQSQPIPMLATTCPPKRQNRHPHRASRTPNTI